MSKPAETKARLYARFSPRPDAATSESNQTQLELCRAYAERQGWRIHPDWEFQDQALSGDDADRPGLWAAVDSLKKGDVLLVYKLDRLARKAYLALYLEEIVAKKGARIVSVIGEGTWNNTPEDELLRNMIQAFNSYIKRAQAARTKAAMRRHQATGRRMSFALPYGRKPDPGDPARMVDCAEEVATLARLRELAAEGLGCCAIARQLTQEGRKCRGKEWHHETIRRILDRKDS
jgi:site-specific DNA recombinase